MTRTLLVALTVCVAAPLGAQPPTPNVVLASRILGDGTRSLLVDVRGPAGTIDELGIELPGGVAELAVPLSPPAGWISERDGRWIRFSGEPVAPPFRVRIALFSDRELERSRVRLRLNGRNVWDGTSMVAPLPALTAAASPVGLVRLPAIVSPGEMIDMEVMDPARTPGDGQWVVAGVAATADGSGRLRVEIPADQLPGSPLRVSYFDVWGERVLDALSAEDVVVTEPTPAGPTAPRITGCSRYGFLGDSVCVCGDFPASSWNGLTIDGQPAAVIAASQRVVHLRLPESLAPGAHVIAGDAAAGYDAGDRVTTRALALRASIDANALLRGQSTTLRVAIEGATEPVTIAITNRTPGIISIAGGNYQEVDAPIDVNQPAELRVDARAVGNFEIDPRIPVPACPCMDEARGDYPSTASRDMPVFVPRRVLATIAAGTPAAMMTTAQAVAAANGLAVVEVTPLALANQALATFEILDGLGAIAKAAALAADPNVTLAQPDFVYDTSQAGPATSGLSYGPAMIGADRARGIARGEGVRVAVIDAGIDTGHPRLQRRVADYVDITGTGWTPDAHGTLVAGVIAAEPAEDDAASGVAPAATIIGVKACVPQSPTRAAARCWSSTLARGIDVASQKNVRIMNLSVGGPEDRLLTRMVDAAAERGIAVVSAAGNDGPSGRPSYPAAIDSVIAVTAIDAAGRLYPRATQGGFIDLAAPGVDILSTGPGGRNQLFSGTSAATAFASGAVALLLQGSKLSTADLRALLKSTARDLGQTGPDAEFGDGLLDVCRAIVASSGRQADCR